MFFTQNIILENHIVLLRPMQESDISGLREIAYDEEIWRLTTSVISNEDELKAYIATALNDRRREFRYPFIVIDKRSGRIAGSTSFGNLSEHDGRVEIGVDMVRERFPRHGIKQSVQVSYAELCVRYTRSLQG